MRNADTTDRRIGKTRKLLHEALLSLLHEKDFNDIVVKEILDRANVGRSTFYAHYRDKNDLLIGGVRDLLLAIAGTPPLSAPGGKIEMLWFSRRIFDLVEQHRRSRKLRMGRDGQIFLHKHLEKALEELISKHIKGELRGPARPWKRIPPDLLVQHVASTFVLVLNWWVDRNTVLDPAEADALFRELIAPALG